MTMRRVGLLLLCAVALRAETVAFLGDSLTAGYGLDESQAYPALVQDILRLRAPTWKVINAGVSGDTTTGAVRRLAWILKAKPDLVVLALGANDGMRGQPVEQIAGNLRTMITRIRAAGAKPLLAGMQLPTNYGADYRAAFAAIYPALATEIGTPLLPFLLAGVAAKPELNQSDGIHPTAAGQQVVARTMLDFLVTAGGLAPDTVAAPTPVAVPVPTEGPTPVVAPAATVGSAPVSAPTPTETVAPVQSPTPVTGPAPVTVPPAVVAPASAVTASPVVAPAPVATPAPVAPPTSVVPPVPAAGP
jgi:acyl-CoA thioesterase-1